MSWSKQYNPSVHGKLLLRMLRKLADEDYHMGSYVGLTDFSYRLTGVHPRRGDTYASYVRPQLTYVLSCCMTFNSASDKHIVRITSLIKLPQSRVLLLNSNMALPVIKYQRHAHRVLVRRPNNLHATRCTSHCTYNENYLLESNFSRFKPVPK